MPVKLIQITAYVRTEEDLAKWKALENKTEWLHQKLNGIEQAAKPTKMNIAPIAVLKDRKTQEEIRQIVKGDTQ